MEKYTGVPRVSPRAGKGYLLLLVALATLLFSVFRRFDAFIRLGDILVGWTSSAALVFLTMALARLVLAGVVVLFVLPPILGFKRRSDWLPGYLRVDTKAVLLGILSFGLFCLLAAAISLGMGIFQGDLSTVFANPDIRPDPDIVGWAYLFLALVPGIWEELAFRGLIQSKLRERFSPAASVLLSAFFFGLFHFTNLLVHPPSQVIGGVIMASLFGISWGAFTIRAQSVVPAMLSHYLVDAMGQVFLSVDSSNPGLATGFFLLLTLAFSVLNTLLARIVVGQQRSVSWSAAIVGRT